MFIESQIFLICEYNICVKYKSQLAKAGEGDVGKQNQIQTRRTPTGPQNQRDTVGTVKRMQSVQK